ncbi:hypothetical protein [Halostella salina]|uniref:hypothetical protein n=1 Tax=Halostella salina TaxID=1547897 RepID=UPI000EF851E1|nr:hypothetical protein [Halostella salina]
MREAIQRLDDAESPVKVIEVGEEYVTLDVPESVHDAERVIPADLVEIGQDARNWFAWDLEEKQPRAPYTNPGYAGAAQWGRENVSWDSRAGGTFEDVIDALDGTVNGHINDSWRWGTVEDDDGNEHREDPRPLYPMAIVPHLDFQPDEDPLMLVDLDDVIEPQDDGTALMTREAWDLIQELDAYTEVSTSMTGVHVFVRAELPGFVDGKKVQEDLTQSLPSGEVGHVEVYGAPANGRVMGTTWMHIDATPRHDVPERQATIDDIVDEHLDDDDTLTPAEQAQAAFDDRAEGSDIDSSKSKSAYYSLNPEPIAQTGPFRAHAVNGEGPHPVHGGTSTPDAKSTNFGVDTNDGWKCWAHEDGGGALQLIAVIEGIRSCGNASDVMQDPVDALRVCLAARDKHATALEDEKPPTMALKGVLGVQGVDYKEDGQLSKANYALAIGLFEEMEYTG